MDNNYNYLFHTISHQLNTLTHTPNKYLSLFSCNITPPCVFNIYLIEPFVYEGILIYFIVHGDTYYGLYFYTNNNINNILIIIQIVI